MPVSYNPHCSLIANPPSLNGQSLPEWRVLNKPVQEAGIFQMVRRSEI